MNLQNEILSYILNILKLLKHDNITNIYFFCTPLFLFQKIAKVNLYANKI